MKYKVAIIEDKKIVYDEIKKHVLRNPKDLEFEDRVRFVENCLNSEYYLNMLMLYKADIYLVDWDLRFQDGSKTSADYVLKAIEKNADFDKKDHYWIFYSGEYVKINTFSKRFFENNAGCFETEGIENLIPLSGDPEYNRDFFREAIDRAIKYLDSTKSPQWSLDLTINNDLPDVEIDMYEQGSIRSVTRDGKLEKIRSNRIKFKLERFLYFIWSHEVDRGMLCLLDEKNNNYQFYLINIRNKSGSVTCNFDDYPEDLFVKSTGFLGRSEFFTDNATLKNKFQEHLKLRSTMLNNIESRLMLKVSEKNKVRMLLGFLRQHGVY